MVMQKLFQSEQSYIVSFVKRMKLKDYVWLILIIVLAFILRYLFLSGPSINGDEGDNLDSMLDVLVRGISPWQRWAGLLPPLSSWTLSFFVRIFGFSEFGVRFQGVVFGTIIVFLVYLLAKLHFGEKVGTLSALLSAVMPLLVLSSRDAHPDIVLILFSLLGVVLFEFGYKYKSLKCFFFGGISAGLALISKYNSVPFFFFYWFFVLIFDFFSKKNKYVQLKKNIRNVLVSVFASFFVLFLSFDFSLKNFFYFLNGVLFWVFNQNLFSNVPWYYSFSVLFDGLSPLLFVFVPFGILIILLFCRNWGNFRNSLFHVFISIMFIVLVTLQGRKFPRHFLLVLPFVSILVADSLMIFRQYVSKKLFVDLFIFIICLSAAFWSVYKIYEYDQYVVWKNVGPFVLSITNNNSTVYVDGAEFWTVKFYTGYGRKVVSKLIPELLNPGDVIIVHSLNKSTSFFIGSPLQNDLFLYSSNYAEQYKFNDGFYSFVRKYGVLLKTFKYDDFGNKIFVYKIGNFLPKKKGNTLQVIKLDDFTQKVCRFWESGGVVKRIMLRVIPVDLQLVVSEKCAKGCVYTCDVF